MSVSYGAEMSTFSHPHASVREFSGRQLEAVPDSQISLLVSSLVAMIRSSSNLGLTAAAWCAEFLPADDVVTGGFTRRLVVGICRAIQPALKLSRWGAFLRLVFLLAMQYQVSAASAKKKGAACRCWARELPLTSPPPLRTS